MLPFRSERNRRETVSATERTIHFLQVCIFLVSFVMNCLVFPSPLPGVRGLYLSQLQFTHVGGECSLIPSIMLLEPCLKTQCAFQDQKDNLYFLQFRLTALHCLWRITCKCLFSWSGASCRWRTLPSASFFVLEWN